ncbi:hypothetical protein BTR23_09020 [Alkalihalophilus pseudofirmus]|nr:hypothetical protein BTR23_09020 [Alkalihalophilus pseudofirmus]
MKKNIYLTLFIVCCTPFLMSCWDLMEIEEIGFLMAVGLDPVENEEEQIRQFERETGQDISRKPVHDQLFNVTFNVAIPSKIEAQEGGRSGQAFFTIATTGFTNFKAVRQIATRRSRRLNFEHLKAIVINEELVRGNPMLEHLADYYIRDHEMRRRTYLYITEENTDKVLNTKLPLEELIATSIVDITENHEAALPMIAPKTIGEISTDITGGHSFLIPRIVSPTNGELKISGAAVFLGRENTMLGWLGEEDIKGYNWIVGEANNGVIEVEYKESEAEFFVYEVITMATTIDYRRENNQNIFDVEIRAEGAFGESWLHGVEISDEETLRELEGHVQKAIQRQADRIIAKMQNEFHTDIFGFHNLVRQQQYNYWKTIDDAWDGEGGVFSDAEVNVNALVKIRHYMLNEKLE